MRRVLIALLLVVATLTATPRSEAQTEAGNPALDVTVVQQDLNRPWGIVFAPDDTMFFTTRPGRIFSVQPPYTGAPTQVVWNTEGLYVNGETGLLDIEVDPDYTSNRRIFTCQGMRPAGQAARIQVISWRVSAENDSLQKIRVVVNNATVFNPDQVGRHGGCRLEFDGFGNLYIGTGDGATANNPQNLTTLGGKVLRVDPDTGAGLPTNPWGDHPNANRRRIWNYGHRNIQGLTLRPGTNTQLWQIEHGTYRQDELNRVIKGRNYGWAPLPPYDESPPMTDRSRFPNAVRATWTSGPSSTIAPSGADFVVGEEWGPWDGALAVAVLKNAELRMFRLAADGALLGVDRPPELNDSFGRLRTAAMGPEGALFITTDENPGQILRVTPD